MCRYILRFLSDKRAVSDVISTTMLAGTVVTRPVAGMIWGE
jgi:hypothetical protein